MLVNDAVGARPLAAAQLEAEYAALLWLIGGVQHDPRNRQNWVILARHDHGLTVLASRNKSVHEHRQAPLEDSIPQHPHAGLLRAVFAVALDNRDVPDG